MSIGRGIGKNRTREAITRNIKLMLRKIKMKQTEPVNFMAFC